jgi:hypothetical protein
MWNNHEVNYKYGDWERKRTKAKAEQLQRNFVLGLLMISVIPVLIIIGFIFK